MSPRPTGEQRGIGEQSGNPMTKKKAAKKKVAKKPAKKAAKKAAKKKKR